MKVYILEAYALGDTIILGAFSSYSAMTTWLKEKYNYESKLEDDASKDFRWFEDTFVEDYERLYYTSYDVIGEHSHKTNTIKFD